MTAILGYSELLLEGSDPISSTPLGVEAVQTIRRNCEHSLAIINDILDLSKIEAGKFDLEIRRCCPKEIAEEVCHLMQVRADEKGIRLQLVVEGVIPAQVLTDGPRLRQILVNLVGNAIKFTETGSVRVIVRSHPQQLERLEFEVADTGIGLTMEQQSRLFQPFSQADTSVSRKFGGTGLGLAISKQLAEALNGGLSVLDSKPNVGTQFVAWILAKDVTSRASQINQRDTLATDFSETIFQGPSNGQTTSLAESPWADYSLEGLRILLAEDGLDNQRLISHILGKAGGQMTIAENGRLAIESVVSAEGREDLSVSF